MNISDRQVDEKKCGWKKKILIQYALAPSQIINLLVLRLDYSGQIRSILQLFMPWLLASPGQQQQPFAEWWWVIVMTIKTNRFPCYNKSHTYIFTMLNHWSDIFHSLEVFSSYWAKLENLISDFQALFRRKVNKWHYRYVTTHAQPSTF